MKSIALLLVFGALFAISPYAQQSQCDYKVEILAAGWEFNANEFRFRIKATNVEGASTNITGNAQIIDSKGKIVKNYRPWTNEAITRQKTSNSYSPNLKEGEQYKIYSWINVLCDDSNASNNVDFKAITIIKPQNETKSNNYPLAETTSSGMPQTIKLEKANDTTFHAETETREQEKNTSNNQSPIDKFDNVINLLPETSANNEQENSESGGMKQDIVYKSSNEKSKELIIFFLLGISILLNVVLIWRR